MDACGSVAMLGTAFPIRALTIPTEPGSQADLHMARMAEAEAVGEFVVNDATTGLTSVYLASARTQRTERPGVYLVVPAHP